MTDQSNHIRRLLDAMNGATSVYEGMEATTNLLEALALHAIQQMEEDRADIEEIKRDIANGGLEAFRGK